MAVCLLLRTDPSTKGRTYQFVKFYDLSSNTRKSIWDSHQAETNSDFDFYSRSVVPGPGSQEGPLAFNNSLLQGPLEIILSWARARQLIYSSIGTEICYVMFRPNAKITPASR